MYPARSLAVTALTLLITLSALGEENAPGRKVKKFQLESGDIYEALQLLRDKGIPVCFEQAIRITSQEEDVEYFRSVHGASGEKREYFQKKVKNREYAFAQRFSLSVANISVNSLLTKIVSNTPRYTWSYNDTWDSYLIHPKEEPVINEEVQIPPRNKMPIFEIERFLADKYLDSTPLHGRFFFRTNLPAEVKLKRVQDVLFAYTWFRYFRDSFRDNQPYLWDIKGFIQREDGPSKYAELVQAPAVQRKCPLFRKRTEPDWYGKYSERSSMLIEKSKDLKTYVEYFVRKQYLIEKDKPRDGEENDNRLEKRGAEILKDIAARLKDLKKLQQYMASSFDLEKARKRAKKLTVSKKEEDSGFVRAQYPGRWVRWVSTAGVKAIVQRYERDKKVSLIKALEGKASGKEDLDLFEDAENYCKENNITDWKSASKLMQQATTEFKAYVRRRVKRLNERISRRKKLLDRPEYSSEKERERVQTTIMRLRSQQARWLASAQNTMQHVKKLLMKSREVIELARSVKKMSIKERDRQLREVRKEKAKERKERKKELRKEAMDSLERLEEKPNDYREVLTVLNKVDRAENLNQKWGAKRLPNYERIVQKLGEDEARTLNVYYKYVVLDEYKKAEQQWKKLLNKNPENTRLLMLKGMKAFWGKNYEEAMAVVNNILDIDPEHTQAQNIREKILRRTRNGENGTEK